MQSHGQRIESQRWDVAPSRAPATRWRSLLSHPAVVLWCSLNVVAAGSQSFSTQKAGLGWAKPTPTAEPNLAANLGERVPGIGLPIVKPPLLPSR